VTHPPGHHLAVAITGHGALIGLVPEAVAGAYQRHDQLAALADEDDS